MKLELSCPRCTCHLAAAPDTPGEKLVAQMTEEGPWFALANGETFEDMVWAALLSRGVIRCPECAEPVSVREQSMGALIDRLDSKHTGGRQTLAK
jgi:hypothetical protein